MMCGPSEEETGFDASAFPRRRSRFGERVCYVVLTIVVPAKAGTHNHRCLWLKPDAAPASRKTGSSGYGSRLRSQGLAWPGRRKNSKQRRDLAYFERPEIHRTVDEAQRKGPRLLAFQHRFAAERVDARGDADAGVLLHHLAEPRDRAVLEGKK